MAARSTVKRLAGGPARRVRGLVQRAFVPQLAELMADRDRLNRELGLAFESVSAAHQGIADLQAEAKALRERLDMTLLLAEANQEEIRQVKAGLLETRRQSLRIAELADVVTEIVLPLHDRDIDPEALKRLSADTY
ncbi:DUF6752 domain-containing protein [Blastococcus sp. LR1]|uniref:DUF6752 domain-containing protein n=1 Tax=Blastococcus sp. LR1 TaxID=2877000 RepID=UPI001CCD58D6|nr:DUF6752 domain-containing protein [Blastococcus sp. LR1]MCA0146225.1 hypothetical protein [Blastococcus sp. LR1]